MYAKVFDKTLSFNQICLDQAMTELMYFYCSNYVKISNLIVFLPVLH